MTPLIQIILGLILLGGGAGLIFWGRRQARRLGFDPIAEAGAVLRSLSQDRDEDEIKGEKEPLPQAETAPVARKLEKGRNRSVHRHSNSIADLVVPMFDYGRVDRRKWAANVANNIYIRCSDTAQGDVRDFIQKGVHSYKKIGDLRQLIPAGWIQILVHEEMLENLKKSFGMTEDELCTEMQNDVLDLASWFIEPHLLGDWRPRFRFYRYNQTGSTGYHLRFYPILPAQAHTPCDGVITFHPSGGKIAVPAEGIEAYQVADKLMDASRYAPFLERYSEEVVIGPHPWCHIQTNRNNFSATLVLTWRKSDDIGITGILEVVDFQGDENLFLEISGFNREPLDKRGAFVKIPIQEGPRTTCTLIRTRGGAEEVVGAIILANPLPDVTSLPGVTLFEAMNWAAAQPRDFARFLVTRIYISTRFKGRFENIRFLFDPAGRAFLDSQNLLTNDGRPVPGSAVTPDDDLHYRLKMILSPKQRADLRAIFGDVVLKKAIVAEVLELINDQNEFYGDLFSEDARKALKDSATRPGLSVEISIDEMVHPEALLLRTLPILASVRRREIFGEVRLDNWKDAREISGMSCNAARTFLIQYPLNTVMMRMSRFPLYGIFAPQVHGVIGIALEEPGEADARLVIENYSQTNIVCGNKTIHPEGGEARIPVPSGQEHRVTLVMGTHSLEIIIYREPVEQMREPEFLPAPGKLGFYGLTLGRRAERTEWKSAPFGDLVNRAVEADLEILGVSQVTRNGYLASLLRDGIEQEVHFFAGATAHLNADVIPAGSSTLSSRPPGLEASIWDDDDPKNVVEYTRIDFTNLEQITHADILLQDFYEARYDELAALLPEGQKITEIDLLRCNPKAIRDMDQHLYLAWDREGESRSGWVYHKPAGIKRIFMDNPDKAMDLDCSGALLGPFDTSRQYYVEWTGEERTALHFEIDTHLEQVQTYLQDGFFSLKSGMYYRPGGIMSGPEPVRFPQKEDVFISNHFIRLNHSSEAVNPKSQLPYDPKIIANYFDKDAYRIGYSANERSFVVTAQTHPNVGTRAKSVFLIVPAGRRPILGSHALPAVALPPGRNLVVFPGITFEFAQGPVYYGFNV